jgi:hypothetical protein
MPYAIAVMRAMVREFGIQVDCIYWDEKRGHRFYLPTNLELAFHKRFLHLMNEAFFGLLKNGIHRLCI